jgi:hypothetical protein
MHIFVMLWGYDKPVIAGPKERKEGESSVLTPLFVILFGCLPIGGVLTFF